jgi:hypothetical protein
MIGESKTSTSSSSVNDGGEKMQDRVAVAQQQAKIEADTNIQTPTGILESPEILLEEYRENISFLPKIQQLCQKYTGIRRSRGDGNCFYRSVAFQVLEHCRISSAEVVEAALKKMAEVADGLHSFFQYERFTYEDFYETFCENAREVQGKGIEAVEELFVSDMGSLMLVYWIRLLTSFAIQSNANTFLPFIMALGYADAQAFCKSQVEPVKVDADQLPVQALSEFMGWQIVVEYLDGSTGPLNQHRFGPVAGVPSVLLLYRPGHYDMLVQ